uniref:ZP domain-containing protein n=1 Tax=Steinernema glaseri TaxID=37863 RepID=A0A1I8AAB2_9BILA
MDFQLLIFLFVNVCTMATTSQHGIQHQQKSSFALRLVTTFRHAIKSRTVVLCKKVINAPFLVTVNCSERNIDVVVKEPRGFYGQIVGGSGSGKHCSSFGDGRPEVHLQMSTDVAKRERCSMVEHEDAYVVTVHVRQMKYMQHKGDSYYVVRCPVKNPKTPKNNIITSELTEVMPSGKLDLKAHNPQVGNMYDVKLEIPLLKEIGQNVRIGPCIAFVGGNDLRVLQLVDENGCPTAEEIPHGFQLNEKIKNASRMEFSTNMKMFTFGDVDHFYLQCQLSKCNNECGVVSHNDGPTPTFTSNSCLRNRKRVNCAQFAALLLTLNHGETG